MPELEVEVDDPAILEDPEVVALLAKANKSLEENPLNRYVPHGRQRIFHEHRLKTKAFVGGNRSGKSTATVIDCLIQAIDYEMVPEHLFPYRIWPKGTKFKCRFITPDYGKPYQSLLETIEMWVPPSQLRGGSWEKAHKDKDHIVSFANGSVFDFMTTEQPPSKHGGSARHRIVWDEEPPDTEDGERIYTQARMRIADYHGDMLWGFTPISEKLGWVFDEIHEEAVEEGEELSERVWRNDEAGLLLVQASIYENPHLSEEGREDAIRGIRSSQRAAVTEGSFTNAKGLVYEDFDQEVHVVDEANIEPEFVAELEHIDGIDPGQVETAILFAGIDKQNRLVIYDELTLSGKAAVPEQAAEHMAVKREGWGLPERAKYTIIDPAARSRDLASGERVGEAWIRAGINVIYGKHDLEAGVLEVKRRMNHTIEVEGEDGPERKPYPLIVISSRCKNLIRQKRKYRQKPKEDGSFGVVKKDDHACDVERYLAMFRPVPIRRRRRARRQAWVPGTAPPFQPTRRVKHGVMGKFS